MSILLLIQSFFTDYLKPKLHAFGQLICYFFYLCSIHSAAYYQADINDLFCCKHHESKSTDTLESIDRQAYRRYPVTITEDQVSIVIVPTSYHESAQHLIAAAYKTLSDQNFDTIIFIGQADNQSFYGLAFPLFLHDNFGSVDISLLRNFLDRLVPHRLFCCYQSPFTHDNNLKMHRTLLDCYVKNVAIIPCIVGHLSQLDAAEIALKISELCTNKTLIIFSSDVASYYNISATSPLDQSKLCSIYEHDAPVIQAIQSIVLQPQMVIPDLKHSSLLLLLWEFLQLSYYRQVASSFVGYATSVDSIGILERIQSYGAFIFQHDPFGYKNHIGSYERSQLLQCARIKLNSLFEPQVFRVPCMISYEMNQPHGLFVSLFAMSDHGTLLRGCMGKVECQTSLYAMVGSMTQQAACHDSRFYPLRNKEIGTTIISLTFISNINLIQACDDIASTHGIMLKYKNKEAIVLPAKKIVVDWNYQSVLNKLSYQMYGQDSIWQKDGAQIFTFSVLEFQEE